MDTLNDVFGDGLKQPFSKLYRYAYQYSHEARVSPFCRQHGKGLASFSEQTFERLHSKWAEYSEYKLRSETTDPEYGNVLLNVVKDLNSLYLR